MSHIYRNTITMCVSRPRYIQSFVECVQGTRSDMSNMILCMNKRLEIYKYRHLYSLLHFTYQERGLGVSPGQCFCLIGKRNAFLTTSLSLLIAVVHLACFVQQLCYVLCTTIGLPHKSATVLSSCPATQVTIMQSRNGWCTRITNYFNRNFNKVFNFALLI